MTNRSRPTTDGRIDCALVSKKGLAGTDDEGSHVEDRQSDRAEQRQQGQAADDGDPH